VGIRYYGDRNGAVVIEKVVSSTVTNRCGHECENLQKAPPVLIIRPARYRDNSALVNNEGKIIAHNDSWSIFADSLLI